jgi:hypothetical protein
MRGFEGLGVWLATGLALAGIAGCDEVDGETASARDAYQQLLTLGEKAGEVGLVAGALEGLARAAIAEDMPARAAELLGRADSLRDEYDRPPTAAEQSVISVTAHTARTALGEREYVKAATRGAAGGLATT